MGITDTASALSEGEPIRQFGGGQKALHGCIDRYGNLKCLSCKPLFDRLKVVNRVISVLSSTVM